MSQPLSRKTHANCWAQVGNKHFKWYQVREALLDPLTWAFFFYALIADIPNGQS